MQGVRNPDNAGQQGFFGRFKSHWALKLILYLIIPVLIASQALRAGSSIRTITTSALQFVPSSWSSTQAMASTGASTRLTIRSRQNFEDLYPMILDYSKHPERAAAVKEVVYRLEGRSLGYFGAESCPTEWIEREEERIARGDAEINNAIHPLGLDQEQRHHWIKTLTWMKPEYVAERKAAREEGNINLSLFFTERDRAFARHAAALLLLICPNIDKLTYQDNAAPHDPVKELLHRNNYGLLPGAHLQKLSHVRLLPIDEGSLGDPRYYVPTNLLGLLRIFHRLPSISNISADAMTSDDRGHREEGFPPGTSSFISVSIEHSQLPSTVIAALIRASKELEEVRLSTGGRGMHEGDGYSGVYPKTLGKALWCHRQTLKRVDLDLDETVAFDPSRGNEDTIEYFEEPWDDLNEFARLDELHAFEDQDYKELQEPIHPSELPNTRPYGLSIGSLHDFSALTHLAIGIELLLSPRLRQRSFRFTPQEAPFRLIDALPKSLEYLLIRGYRKGEDFYFDKQISEFMGLKGEKLPNLRVVEGVEEYVPSAKMVEHPSEEEDNYPDGGGRLFRLEEAKGDLVEVLE